MSTDQNAPSPPPDLQFERATFDPGTAADLACQLCQTRIASAYFDVNGQPVCPTCREQLVASVGADHGLRGVLAAVMAGFGAAVAGALLYYAVLAITGYEIGLIAVAVGWLVGSAVKWGAGRGGRRFQILAVTLTYLAIISTYVPFVFAGAQQAQTARESAASSAPATTPGGSSAGTSTENTAAPAASPSQPATQAADAVATQAPSDEAPLSGRELVKALALMIGVLLVLPFLAGFQNIIGWVIIGIALWEAWKLNRPVTLVINGPFQISAVPPPPPVPVPS